MVTFYSQTFAGNATTLCDAGNLTDNFNTMAKDETKSVICVRMLRTGGATHQVVEHVAAHRKASQREADVSVDLHAETRLPSEALQM